MFTRIFRTKAGALLIIGLVVGMILLFGTHGFPGSTIGSGWELKAEIMAVSAKNAPYSSFLPPPINPLVPVPGSSDQFMRKFDRAARAQYDFDSPDWGMPDVMVESGNAREEIPAKPYGPAQYDLGKFKYTIEYHEYLFDVNIRSVAGVKLDPKGGHAGYWDHETSMPHSWADNFFSGGDKVGKPIYGNVYVRFANTPWGMSDFNPPSGYVYNGYWLGIMDSTLQKQYGGKVESGYQMEENFKGFAQGLAAGNTRFNMFADDGTFGKAYAPIPQGDKNKILDPDIESTVIVELPYGLLAGADDAYSTWLLGVITDVKPIDYFIQYTIRMETVVVKEYMQRDPALSPNNAPIAKPKDYVSGNVPSWWDRYGLYLIIGGIVVVILLVLAAILGFPIFAILLGR